MTTSPPCLSWLLGFSFRRALLGAFVSLAIATGVFAQGAATGVVSGRVFSPATGEYIRNAEVRIQGTQQFALTEDGGFYRLDNAPAGEVTVVVTYTGYDTATAKLTVTAGATATRDFELAGSPGKASKQGEIVKLDSFVVATEREGNAKAIMEQKGAMNVKTVISADSFGDIAEGNVGEFLKFMPGIVLDYVETDTRAAAWADSRRVTAPSRSTAAVWPTPAPAPSATTAASSSSRPSRSTTSSPSK